MATDRAAAGDASAPAAEAGVATFVGLTLGILMHGHATQCCS